MEKVLRIYDLERPDAAPQQLLGTDKGIRNIEWVHNDSMILTTQQDTPGLDVWDMRSGEIVKSLHTDTPVSSVDVSRTATCMGGEVPGGWGWERGVKVVVEQSTLPVCRAARPVSPLTPLPPFPLSPRPPAAHL